MRNVRIISMSALTTVGVPALLAASLWLGGQAIAGGAFAGHRGGTYCERIGGHAGTLDNWLRDELQLTAVQNERLQAVVAHVQSAEAGARALCAQRSRA